MNFREHPSMNFKDPVMSKRNLNTSLVSDEFGVRLSITITSYEQFKSRELKSVREDGKDFDFGLVVASEEGSWTIEASTLTGLADGVRANLSRILVILEENGFVRNHGSSAEGCNTGFLTSQFNTGNDFKLVCGFLDFLTEISYKEQA
jgi:hypothetical protein